MTEREPRPTRGKLSTAADLTRYTPARTTGCTAESVRCFHSQCTRSQKASTPTPAPEVLAASSPLATGQVYKQPNKPMSFFIAHIFAPEGGIHHLPS